MGTVVTRARSANFNYIARVANSVSSNIIWSSRNKSLVQSHWIYLSPSFATSLAMSYSNKHAIALTMWTRIILDVSIRATICH